LLEFAPWNLITRQVLDGPPGDITRRLSSFLLIHVGFNRQGFAFVDRLRTFSKPTDRPGLNGRLTRPPNRRFQSFNRSMVGE
jgi:hypothetical protein